MYPSAVVYSWRGLVEETQQLFRPKRGEKHRQIQVNKQSNKTLLRVKDRAGDSDGHCNCGQSSVYPSTTLHSWRGLVEETQQQFRPKRGEKYRQIQVNKQTNKALLRVKDRAGDSDGDYNCGQSSVSSSTVVCSWRGLVEVTQQLFRPKRVQKQRQIQVNKQTNHWYG